MAFRRTRSTMWLQIHPCQLNFPKACQYFLPRRDLFSCHRDIFLERYYSRYVIVTAPAVPSHSLQNSVTRDFQCPEDHLPIQVEIGSGRDPPQRDATRRDDPLLIRFVHHRTTNRVVFFTTGLEKATMRTRTRFRDQWTLTGPR